jgi:hypothetical protein
VKHKLKPAAATPAPELAALEEPTPQEPAPEADTTLPDLPPPEPQQAEARAGGEEQVEAPDAAPADGTGKRLTAPGWLLRPQALCSECILACRCPAITF